jgi:dTDP-4-amino-4,6-dideoxygalactose transaminase
MPDVKIRFQDLRVTDPDLKARLLAAVERVLDHGMVIGGPELESFETAFAAFAQCPYAVGVGNGSSALYLALRALGIGAGDEVITTPLSWVATANAIHMTGATPVMVDIGDDLNIDPARIETAVTERTRAILPVHFTGRVCDMAPLMEIARRRGLLVVEDAAQAAGALYDGRPAGSFGDAAAFSFNPMKVFGAYGEAGMVTMPRAEVRDSVLSLRYLGTINKEICITPELNHKMDPLQAAMLGVVMADLDRTIARRVELARHYRTLLEGIVTCPIVDDTGRSVHFDFTIQADRRDALRDALLAAGIEVKVKHAPLMCDQPAYRHLPRFDVPRARAAVDRILTLPLHLKMTAADVDAVAGEIRRFYGANAP